MSNQQNQNESTDRNEARPATAHGENSVATQAPPRERYEVVFFANYNYETYTRPTVEEITNYFGRYGQVHHVNCPEGKTYAFIFMTSLNTTAEHRRTRTTIGKIIDDMTDTVRFHITVASSNRNRGPRSGRFHSNRRRFQQPRSHYSGQGYRQPYSDRGNQYRTRRYAPRTYVMRNNTSNRDIYI